MQHCSRGEDLGRGYVFEATMARPLL